MTKPNFDALNVGDEIPSLTTEPVSRLTLALYATGSGDHHPLHLDQDYVRSKGIPMFSLTACWAWPISAVC
jgi:acyl dehydratase